VLLNQRACACCRDDPAAEPQKRAEAISSGRLPYRELQHLYEETADKLRRVANEKDEIAMLAQQRQVTH